jgi:tRNA pseudouridine55 synthase
MERTRDDSGEDLDEPATKKRRLNQEGHQAEDPTSQNLSLAIPEQHNEGHNTTNSNTNNLGDCEKGGNATIEDKSSAEATKPVLPKVLNIYKPISKTPLEVIQALQQKLAEYSQIDPETGRQVKIGYAGRLDPMAHGVLILLMGEENKDRKSYENLKKEYRFEVMFGLTTDTYDILGMIDSSEIKVDVPIEDLQNKVDELITKEFIGQHDQPYPPYSSARVKGKPLFQWARDGKLNEIEIPVKRITIEAMKIFNIYEISIEDMERRIIERINGVKGDFRQKEITEKWRQVFGSVNTKDFKLQIVTIDVQVTTGTYVRSIAHELGKKMGRGAIVVDLLRTRAGEFKLDDSLRLEETIVNESADVSGDVDSAPLSNTNVLELK